MVHLIATIVGILGAICIMAMYFLLQINKIDSNKYLFSVVNSIGSIALLFSLVYNWNIGSVVIEVFWLAISLGGVHKVFMLSKIKRQTKTLNEYLAYLDKIKHLH